MARSTRSRKVDIDIAEDSTAQQYLQVQSTTLAEISNTMAPQSEDVVADTELKVLKAAYREAIGTGKKGRKGKGKKKGKQDFTVETEEVEGAALTDNIVQGEAAPAPEVQQQIVESEGQPLRASVRTTRRQAAKQAGQYGSFASTNLQFGMSQRLKGISFLSLFGGRPVSRAPVRPVFYEDNITDYHSSLAEEALSQSVGYIADESVGDEALAPIPQDTAKTLIDSPTKKTLQQVEEIEEIEAAAGHKEAEEQSEDSFVEQIIGRSPAKPVTRIEDSVEALDQLEDALEALNQAALAEKFVSPEKTRTPTVQKTKVEPLPKAVVKKVTNSKPSHATVRVKPTAPKQQVVKRAASVTLKSTSTAKAAQDQKREQTAPKVVMRRPISLFVPKEPTKTSTVQRPVSMIAPKGTVKSTKAPTRPNFELPGEAIAQKLKEQREARIAQRQSSADSFHIAASVSVPKIKSTKPPTKPHFELPGEALSRKKKEEHEARLKVQEEEERKRREFKAKPVRASIQPSFVPRETVASRARQSKVGVEIEDANLIVSKRGCNIGAHRPSIVQLTMANTSAPRAPGPAVTRKTPLVVKPTTMSGLPPHLQRTVSATEVNIQRQRGREIYNRDAKLAEDIQREKEEREVAAKRARAEAAERGRQASREWAAKQMAKKMAEGDKGLAHGYGPGGQMGLAG